jgi:hypothetical protein
MDKKKSINNIQDLGFSADSQHCIGWQLIPLSIFRIFLFLIIFYFIYSLKLSIFRQNLFLEIFYYFPLQGIGWQPIPSAGSPYPQIFKKSINQRFVHN